MNPTAIGHRAGLGQEKLPSPRGPSPAGRGKHPPFSLREKGRG